MVAEEPIIVDLCCDTEHESPQIGLKIDEKQQIQPNSEQCIEIIP